MLGEIMDDEARGRLERDHDVDFAYEVPGVVRVRCNVFHLHLGLAGAFRILPSRIYTAEELGLTAQLTQLTELKRGLVIATHELNQGDKKKGRHSLERGEDRPGEHVVVACVAELVGHDRQHTWSRGRSRTTVS